MAAPTSEAVGAAPAAPAWAADSSFREPAVPEGHHKLNSAWTLWYAKKPSKDDPVPDWTKRLEDLGTFNTIEGFWALYSHVMRPSHLPNNSNYYLCRNHIMPMWENFPNGGAFNLRVEDYALDRSWEELFLAAIGEEFGEPDVVAIVCSIRHKQIFLSVWNADNLNHAVRFEISQALKRIFSLPLGETIEYKTHQSSIKDGSTFCNANVYRSYHQAAMASGEAGADDDADMAASPSTAAMTPADVASAVAGVIAAAANTTAASATDSATASATVSATASL